MTHLKNILIIRIILFQNMYLNSLHTYIYTFSKLKFKTIKNFKSFYNFYKNFELYIYIGKSHIPFMYINLESKFCKYGKSRWHLKGFLNYVEPQIFDFSKVQKKQIPIKLTFETLLTIKELKKQLKAKLKEELEKIQENLKRQFGE